MKRPELLAPAGDLERLKVALMYGADAVYIGGSLFSLRANAINFNKEQMIEGIEFAHNLKKKIYVTVNISLHSKEMKMAEEYLKELKAIDVDAIIASDPTIVKMAHQIGLEVHLSTQQSTINYEAALFWKSIGVTRIVLAREANKDEIKEIIEKTGMAIEVFIHGAMCSAYSGRCVLSNYFTARDSNRGGCSQICRWDFDLLDSNLNNLTREKKFSFSTKDLSQFHHIEDMINKGITSFKIEGRMRSIYYVATVVSSYRKLIDSILENKEIDYSLEIILDKVSNRDSTSHFYNYNEGVETQYYNNRLEPSNQDFLGLVLDYEENYLIVEQRNNFKVGQIVEFFNASETSSIKIEEMFNEKKELILEAPHPKQIIYIKSERKYMPYTMMRKKVVDNENDL
jgi:putative protease